MIGNECHIFLVPFDHPLIGNYTVYYSIHMHPDYEEELHNHGIVRFITTEFLYGNQERRSGKTEHPFYNVG